jgi:Ras-related protein Rab-7A
VGNSNTKPFSHLWLHGLILTFASVGKTFTCEQCLYKKSKGRYKAAIGACFLTKEIFIDDKEVTMQVYWENIT